MKKVILSALAALALSSLALPSQGFAQVVPATPGQVALDPTQLMGSVTVENGKTATVDLRLPLALIGPFNAFNVLPATWRGVYPAYDIGALTRIVEVRGPAGVTVELLRSHFGQLKGDASEQVLMTRLRVGVNNPEFSAGRRISVQITLENAQNKNRLSFVLEVNSR